MIKNIYFSYGGFYAVYEIIGAIRELYTDYKSNNSIISKKCVIHGCSAGAGMSFLFLLLIHDYIKLDEIESIMNYILDKTSHITVESVYMDLLDVLFTKYCPPDITFLSTRLKIGVSSKNNNFEFLTNFKSKSDMYHALLLSANLIGISKCPSIYNNKFYLDGALHFDSNKHLPKNCLVIYTLQLFPIYLTIPPTLVRKCLIKYGSYNALKLLTYYKKNKKNKSHEITEIVKDTNSALIFFIHEHFCDFDHTIIDHINTICQTKKS